MSCFIEPPQYFADSAGKKGGEFYTPNEVVKLLVRLLRPAKEADIYDPTVGSGGMLIECKNYVEARYNDTKGMNFFGQELNATTWSLCKMNMLFHDIYDAKIEQGDTLSNPLHVEEGELKTFDIVLANPPFSQNYKLSEKFTSRFTYKMPEKKKADFMFVQHMVSVLKDKGRMAVILPHGVLFRSGEEKTMRKWLTTSGLLEAVIGLPSSLFYGTGIPASALVINKAGRKERKGVFFINADREYKEGKNQNKLRPEDLEKISYVFHQKLPEPKYSKLVLKADLAEEDYNFNIRRYVDNSPPPEPQDVRAHLHGGIPLAEVDALQPYFANYKNLRTELFAPLRTGYVQFQQAIAQKGDIKKCLDKAAGIQATEATYQAFLESWWTDNVAELQALPTTQNVFDLNKSFSESISTGLTALGVLDDFKARGAFAAYWDVLNYDLKSVAASGWSAELIPDEELLASQFPEVIAELKENEQRKEELESLFKSVEDAYNNEESDDFEESEYEVLPKALLKIYAKKRKELGGDIKSLTKNIKTLEKRYKATAKPLKVTLTKTDWQLVEVMQTGVNTELDVLIQERKTALQEVQPLQKELTLLDTKTARHDALSKELSACKAIIAATKKKREELIAKAREKITEPEAEVLILARWKRTLPSVVFTYLQAYRRELQTVLDNLWDKYTTTLTTILEERETENQLLNAFLMELGYE